MVFYVILNINASFAIDNAGVTVKRNPNNICEVNVTMQFLLFNTDSAEAADVRSKLGQKYGNLNCVIPCIRPPSCIVKITVVVERAENVTDSNERKKYKWIKMVADDSLPSRQKIGVVNQPHSGSDMDGTWRKGRTAEEYAHEALHAGGLTDKYCGRKDVDGVVQVGPVCNPPPDPNGGSCCTPLRNRRCTRPCTGFKTNIMGVLSHPADTSLPYNPGTNPYVPANVSCDEILGMVASVGQNSCPEIPCCPKDTTKPKCPQGRLDLPPSRTVPVTTGMCSHEVISIILDPNVLPGSCPYSLSNNINGSSSLVGVTFPVGETIVTWTLTDCENTVNCSSTVIIVDNEPPTIICPPSVTTNNTPGLCSYSGTLYNSNCLPPLNAQYTGEFVLEFSNGLLLRNPVHKNFTQCYPPPLNINDSNTYSFGSQVEMDVSTDGGITWLPVSASGTTVVRIKKTGQSGSAESYDTEMLQLNISGGSLPPVVMIRESPTKQSIGLTNILQVGGGGGGALGYSIDSFFDIFLEVSTDGGASWHSSLGNAHMHLPLTSLSITPFYHDNCSATLTAVRSDAPATLSDPYPVGTTTINWTATDPSGNSAACSSTVTVNDTELPVINCPPPITVNNDSGECSYSGLLNPSNCFPPLLSKYEWDFDYAGGILMRNFTIKNFTQCDLPPANPGFSMTHSFDSYVEMQVSMDGGLIWMPTTASGMISLQITKTGQSGSTESYDTEMLQLNISGGTLPSGVMIRESPTEPSRGVTSIHSLGGGFMVSSFFDIFTEVSTDGGMSWTPASDSSRMKLVTSSALSGPVYHDNCSATLTAVRSDAPATLSDPYPVGTTTINWTATDPSGNSTACSSTVTVIDTEFPSITCPPDYDLIACSTDEIIGLVYSESMVFITETQFVAAAGSVSDNCGISHISYIDRKKGLCPLIVTRTFTAVDVNNNITTCQQIIRILNPPAYLICGPDIELPPCTPYAQMMTAYNNFQTPPLIQGGCYYHLLPMVIPPPPHICGGSVTITWKAVCMCGDSLCNCPPVSCTRTFTLLKPPPAAINCPNDLSLLPCTPGNAIQAAYTNWLVSAQLMGGCYYVMTNNAPLLPPDSCGGSVTVTWTAQCMCGEAGCNCPVINCSRTFTIEAPAELSIKCPPDPDLPVCSSPAEILAAYNLWKAGFFTTGGCNVTTNILSLPPLPDLSNGGQLIFNYQVMSSCFPYTLNCNSSFTVALKRTLSGMLKYNNAVKTPMNKVVIGLYTNPTPFTAPVLLDTSVTADGTGAYYFGCVKEGATYLLSVKSNKKPTGGVNITDAGAVNFFSSNYSQLEWVKFMAGDISNDWTISATDAIKIQENFVRKLPFDRFPWSYWKANEFTPTPFPGYPLTNPNPVKVTIAGNTIRHLYAMCTGDFNGSFIPTSSLKNSPSVSLEPYKKIYAAANTMINLPIQIAETAKIGAVSLVLNFPSEMAEIVNVSIPGQQGQLDWAVYGDELRIGWYGENALILNSRQNLIILTIKLSPLFYGDKVIRFNLASDALIELADEQLHKIENAVLLVDEISSASLGLSDVPISDGLMISSYPNPFNGYTHLLYLLTVDGTVKIEIYNVIGIKVSTLINEYQLKGSYSYNFDSKLLSPGIYTATIKLKTTKGEITRTIKMIREK